MRPCPSRRRPGRRPAQRAAYVDVFRRSDLSAATFCREYGLTPATFARWRRTAPRSRRARPAPLARVVLADAAPAVATLRVVIRGVQGEAEITGVDARTVRRTGPGGARGRGAVIAFGSGRPIYLAPGVTDLRKSFPGLYALVRERARPGADE